MAAGKMDIKAGDLLTLKKKHPCGAHTWRVLRVGADFKLKCSGCGHEIMAPRLKIERDVRAVGQEEIDSRAVESTLDG